MSDKLTISASQLATAWDCERKWWLERVALLPDVPKPYLTFGTVLHACLERWCSADETGRAEDGRPIEVFPPGWEEVEEKGITARVTPNEAALIRRLVDQAVERGIVQRGDGRVLERELRLPVIEGVDLVGFVDVFVPGTVRIFPDSMRRAEQATIPEIHDHKTFGESSTRFLKQPGPESPNYIGADQQLLTYAAATSLADGWDGPVVVRHNQFPKFDDPRGVRSVEAVVPPEVWAEHWTRVQETAARLLQIREIKRWDDVPGPYGSEVCQKYGGCPFRDICGKRSTLDGFRATVERRRAEQGARPNLSTAPRRRLDQMTNTVDIFARARRSAAQPAATAASVPQSTQAATEKPGSLLVATEAPASAPSSPGINGGVAMPTAPVPLPGGYVPPPWANPACTACRGLGFNSKGRPCPICDALAKRSKRPTSSMYLVAGSMLDGFTAVGRSEKTADLFALSAPESWSSRGGTSPAVVQDIKKAAALIEERSAKDAEARSAGTPQPSSTAADNSATAGSQPVCAEAPAAVQLSTAANIPIMAVLKANSEQVKAVIDGSAEPEERKGRGRPKAGVTLLIGCAQMKGPDRPTTTIQELLLKLGAELAKDMGAASYWELDAFKRRDRIRQRAETIAEGLGRTVLLVPGVRDPDADSLVGALLPFADLVIEGVR